MTNLISGDKPVYYRSLKEKHDIVQFFIDKGFWFEHSDSDTFFGCINAPHVTIRLQLQKHKNFGCYDEQN